MHNTKIYLVGGNKYLNYISWIPNYQLVSTIEEADIVWFCGGEDVSPWIYGKKENGLCQTNESRDIEEINEFTLAVSLNKFICSTCRGSQLTCVLSGGLLIQHMSHPYIHDIITKEGTILKATSTHHQMQYPYTMDPYDYEIIATSMYSSPLYYFDEYDKYDKLPKGSKDVEICYYRNTNALAIQPHIEIEECSSETRDYVLNIIKEKLNANNNINEPIAYFMPEF